MATRNVKLTGKILWARVFEENRDLEGYDGMAKEFDGQLTVQVVLDKDEYEKLKDARSMKYRPFNHQMPDGKFSVKFSRKWDTGQEWNSGKIPVNKPDGSPWVYDLDGPIPNESEAEVFLSVYDIKGRSTVGTRLDGINVLREAEMPEAPSGRVEADEEVPF